MLDLLGAFCIYYIGIIINSPSWLIFMTKVYLAFSIIRWIFSIYNTYLIVKEELENCEDSDE